MQRHVIDLKHLFEEKTVLRKLVMGSFGKEH